jgi:hypothetical protein
MSILDFKKKVYKKNVLSYSPFHRNKIHNITISSSKNDFLVFQLVGFSFLDDEKMLIVVYYILM